jgi:hypothetical protein
MPLVLKLAARNLLYDKLRFAATVIGIVFSIVLVTVQLGLFVSFERTVTIMIDHAPADLWIVPLGTKCFEDPSLLDEANRYRALSIEGVSQVDPILISFAQWRMPNGGASPVLVIGSDLRVGGLLPWNLVEGGLDALSVPDSVAVDRTYADRLGVKGIGDAAEMRDRRAEVRAVTNGIRSFTTTPYVFTQLDRARAYTGTPRTRCSARHGGRLGRGRADFVCKHQGASLRICHAARDRLFGHLSPHRHHCAGAVERSCRFCHRLPHRAVRRQGDLGLCAAGADDAGADRYFVPAHYRDVRHFRAVLDP